MNPGAVSLFVMLLGLFSVAFMIAYQKTGFKKAAAAIFTGLVAGLANMLVEFLAARHEIYFVFGLLPVGHSSLALTVGWITLAASFVLGSERLLKYSRPRLALSAYVTAGILAGLFSDYLGQILFGHFKLGPNGNWPYICLVWITLLPATMVVYKILLKAIK